ncbi:MAG: hypothetical protein WCY25_06485 [Moheibacter sp.]
MKKFVLISFFMMIGAFVFGQSSCSCGTPTKCSASCGAGKMAVCQGYGGACQCGCVPVGPPPIGKISFPEIVPEIKDCGVMSPEYIAKLTDIEFYEFNFTEEQNAKIYNDFMDRINSLACL